MTRRGSPVPEMGFTLVELLIVIGIIALLISILLPALNRARMSAQNVQCLSNLRQIGQVLVMYAQANRQKFPPGNREGDWRDWREMLGEFMTGREGAPYPLVFRCPRASFPEGNFHYTGLLPYFPPMPVANPPARVFVVGSLGEIATRASERVLIVDGTQDPTHGNANSVGWDIDGSYEFHDQSVWDNGHVPRFGNPTDRPGVHDIRWRHGGGRNQHLANFLFADGHASPHAWGELKKGNFRADSRGRKWEWQ